MVGFALVEVEEAVDAWEAFADANGDGAVENLNLTRWIFMKSAISKTNGVVLKKIGLYLNSLFLTLIIY